MPYRKIGIIFCRYLTLPINLFLMDCRCLGLPHQCQRMIVRDPSISHQLILLASLLCLMWQLVRINKDYVRLTKSSMVSRPITIAYAYRLWCHIGGGASWDSVSLGPLARFDITAYKHRLVLLLQWCNFLRSENIHGIKFSDLAQDSQIHGIKYSRILIFEIQLYCYLSLKSISGIWS